MLSHQIGDPNLDLVSVNDEVHIGIRCKDTGEALKLIDSRVRVDGQVFAA